MSKIRVALTEQHGMALEMVQFPPQEISYSFISSIEFENKFFRSPIKGFFSRFDTNQHDLIEAILSPIRTNNIWIYSLANFHEALAFNFLGVPLPRIVRVSFMKTIFKRSNFKKFIFWSLAGRETLKEYPMISDDILQKVEVVYPAVRKVSGKLLSLNRKKDSSILLLFYGDFFRKGGVNVIDAFETIKKIYPKVGLILCCDKNIDFNTSNFDLRKEYLEKIYSNKDITVLGRVPRDKFLKEVLPKIDIYLLPTYYEAFGFAVLEAMSYGIPVISTNLAAIPEMIEHDSSGFLIDIKRFNTEKMFQGYVVEDIPENFRKYITNNLISFLKQLLISRELRRFFAENSLKIVKEKFSFDTRNKKMKQIYKEVLSS